MSIHFVLDVFSSSQTMDLSAILDPGLEATTLDVSAEAIYYIGRGMMEKIFRFSSNSWDVNDISAEDVHYFTFMENWPDDFDLNPVNGQMNSWGAQNPILDLPDRTIDPARMLVKHDFIRYLALKLFNTPHGVDLFNNEVALVNELNRLGGQVWNDISGILWAKNAYTDLSYVNDTDYEANNAENTKFFIDASANRVCTTDDFSGNQNITRELFKQLINQQPTRFNDISYSSIDVGGTTVDYTIPLPFRRDDFISFKCIIHPAANQHELTDVTEFGGRSYKINLIVKDEYYAVDWNTVPTD